MATAKNSINQLKHRKSSVADGITEERRDKMIDVLKNSSMVKKYNTNRRIMDKYIVIYRTTTSLKAWYHTR